MAHDVPYISNEPGGRLAPVVAPAPIPIKDRLEMFRRDTGTAGIPDPSTTQVGGASSSTPPPPPPHKGSAKAQARSRPPRKTKAKGVEKEIEEEAAKVLAKYQDEEQD